MFIGCNFKILSVIGRMVSRICYLVDKETSKKIVIPNDQVKVIGRSPETEVKDLFVSKSQLELWADNQNCKVKVRPIGGAICGIDGYAIVKGRTYTVGHGHIIELRLGLYKYEIIFDPPPDDLEDHVHVTKKQKLDFPIFDKNATNDSKTDVSVSGGGWEAVDNKELLIYTPSDIEDQKKIAAFDIDGTVIVTKSGARFPKDGDDWKFLYSDIPKKLKTLFMQNYKLVFLTNQSGIGKDASKIKVFKYKIENILKTIGLPIQVYIATGRSIHRKPCPGMWNTLTYQKNGNVPINIGDSFYVGDAAGRDKGNGRKTKDHSCADRLFALNIGLKFYTPEEYFLKAKPLEYKMPEFDPRILKDDVYPDINFGKLNVVMMVGGPGSGKSYYCKTVLVPKGYVHINRDTLGSWQKCVKKMEECLQSRKNCVVDNTNLEKQSRSRFIDVAKKFSADCRCFMMSTSLQHSKHNNKFRELTDKSHIPVSDIIINSFKKNYQEPEISEGFKEIVHVPFIPSFHDKEQEILYKMFLLEK